MLLDAPTVLDAWAFPDATAAGLAQWTPQAGLIAVLDELRPSELSEDGRIDALVAVERHIAMLQARSAELLAALDAGDSSEDGWTRDAVAAALRVPPASMKTRMSDARDLTSRLPATLELLRAGGISQRHAVDLVDATRSLPVEKVAIVEAAVLGRAAEQTVAQFRAATKRAVLAVTDPAADEAEAHQDAVAERRVIFTPVEHGMTELWAYLSADGAAAIKTTLDAMAHKTIHQRGGDDRTADQRRADALVTLAQAALTATCNDTSKGSAGVELASGHGQRPAIQVTIAASTLMGLDDQPAELDGYGAITAATARRIAADDTATWRRLLTDDTGYVLHAGTHSYRPTARSSEPSSPATSTAPTPAAGDPPATTTSTTSKPGTKATETTEANTTSLCRRHHRLTHTNRWRIDRDHTTGTTTWTDRRGRQHRTQPPTLPTTTTTGPIAPSAPTPATSRLAGLRASVHHLTTSSPNELDPPPF